MFTNSDIEKKFKCTKTKLGCGLPYGLGPFFFPPKNFQSQDYVISMLYHLKEIQTKWHKRFKWIQLSDFGVRMKTRFLISCFLGHAMANDLLINFISALKEQGLNMKTMIKVSMDGSSFTVHTRLLRTSAIGKTPVFMCLFTAFSKKLSNQMCYQYLTQSSLFQFKFWCVKWVGNSKVLKRACIAALFKDTNCVRKIHLCQKDELLAAKLGFKVQFRYLVRIFSSQITKQTSHSFLSCIGTDLNWLIAFLMNEIVNHDLFTAAGTKTLIVLPFVRSNDEFISEKQVTAALEVLLEHKQLACEAADLANWSIWIS
ncbi:hypothetical protein PR048_002941 [Dryococelus australis]|uniref:Uncharacterized protein n=1 Tax=Dryococelus australis TaxID=614101 RepID=A0ABQ9IM61_9NEOP|nr:hypothetical protein PR048_002941 [Dryococelus australis]